MLHEELTPPFARGIDDRRLAGIEVPVWLDRHMIDSGLADPLKDLVRRLYRASQYRIRERLRITGATSLEELLAMDEGRDRDEALREAGVPQLLLEICAGQLDMTEPLAWAEMMRDTGVADGQSLVLCGPTGVGKSTAMAWLARELVAQGRRPVWYYAPE